ncbi:MAG: exo-alpha-sialidase [Cyclobacteriaceae bacterium]
MKNNLIAILLTLSLLSCSTNSKQEESAVAVTTMSSPAGAQSATPHLFTDKNGMVYLSWTEKTDTLNWFKFSQLEGSVWSSPSVITTGNTWFVNWADYPMIASDGGDNMISHVLDKSGDGTYAYDVRMTSSHDRGQSWNQSFVLHDDGKQAEHGFVTLKPYDEHIFVAWLDGRNTVPIAIGKEGMASAGHDAHDVAAGPMSLRAAILDYDGNKIEEWELDNKTCDCCQTDAAITSKGPVVVYRDRSDEEIRDMSIVRLVEGKWTTPKTIYADNWKIAGCPVNGPRVASLENTIAIAWFGMSNEQAEVKVIFSQDAGETFAQPIRVDEGKPIGRVDIVMLDKDNAMVSWMEDTDIKVVKVNRDGSKGSPVVIATSSESRSSGFPQMTKSGNELIFAWTDDAEKKVKVAKVSL